MRSGCSAMNSYVFAVDEWTSKEYLQELQSSARKQRPTLYQGEQKFMLNTSLKNRVWGGNDYYFWCFGMDDNYNINSENAEETIKTGEIPVTDDCTFTVDVLNDSVQIARSRLRPRIWRRNISSVCIPEDPLINTEPMFVSSVCSSVWICMIPVRAWVMAPLPTGRPTNGCRKAK